MRRRRPASPRPAPQQAVPAVTSPAPPPGDVLTGVAPGPQVREQQRALPQWLRRTVAYGIAFLVLSAVAWLVVTAALKVALIAFTLVVAVLLTALLGPLVRWLCRHHWPSALAAIVSIVVLVAIPAGVGVLVYSRASTQLADLTGSITAGIDTVRSWLVSGPLGLDPGQVPDLRDTAVDGLRGMAPAPGAAAQLTLSLLTAFVFALFALFFMLKDGDRMWAWFLGWVKPPYRDRADGAGREAWTALSGYVRGMIVIATADALLIGAGLYVLEVPLWLSLTLLTFVAAFVPILGAVVAGALAVLVTLVTNSPTDAVIVLVIVLAVQQIEGNILQPLVMGHAVGLHSLVILTVVACGTLLLGIAGAVIAVPLVAMLYKVVAYLAGHEHAGEDEKQGQDHESQQVQVEKV